MRFNLLGLLLILIVMAACNDKPSDTIPPQDPGDLTVSPGALQITILVPETDGKPLSSYSVLSGDCGIPGNPIEISGGGVTLYSICQNDYSWSAPITAVSAPEGAVQYSVVLKDKLLSSSSPVVQRSFLKKDGICLDAVNRGKLYANLGSADGTNTPYKICTPTQFSNIRFNPSKKFQLAQDIDFAEITIAPIAVAFTGELDGQGFTMKDFIVKDVGGTGTSVGIFKYAQNATIKNINIKNALVDSTQRVGIIAGDWRGGGLIENVNIQGSVKAVTMAGGLIGLGNTAFSLTVRNVKTQLEVTANNYAGGVIGYINTNDGSFNVENSQIRANVSGNTWTGGIAGQIFEDNTIFTNVTHRGNVTSLTEKVGGLAGEINGGTFTNVGHIGTVSTTKDNVDTNVGGLIGISTKPVIINGANVVSTISAGGNYTGGLVGRLYAGTITNAVSRVTINVEDNYYNTPQKFVGGIIGGTNLDTVITDSQAVVNLNAKAYYVGGLIGNMNGASSSIQRSYVTGSISGKVSNIAGLVGNFAGNSISQSFSRANITITGPTPNSYIGGLVGMSNNPSATFIRLYNSGNITILDGTPDMVGGIFGYVKALAVKQTYASGNIAGARSKVGGIAGYAWAPISESFFSGSIVANLRYIGGIAGVTYQSLMTDNFVISPLIQGSSEVGGIAGWIVEGNGAQIARSYFSGHVKKNEISTGNDSTFGAITGIKDTNATLADTFFDTASTFIRLSDSLPIDKNSFGLSLSSSSLRNQNSYTNFNFISSSTVFNWQMPMTGFKLPFKSTDHLFAIHDWLTEPNQGLAVPTIYTDDPINQIQPDLFDPLQNILSSFSQDEFAIISSTSAPTTVTQGQLQISFVSPATDGQPIATKLLIHGECGVPGAKVSLTGSFVLNTVCQSNFRWAAIIDATSKPTGNLTISAKLYNLSQTSFSPTVTRILNKNSSICADNTAIRGIFANSHLGGNGTTVPYKICHVGHLRNLAYYPAASVELANDVDFGGNSFEPILTTFKGTLNGMNFRLRNMVISKGTMTSVGLFSSVQNATLKNIIIEKFSVTGNERVGVFAGDWRGTGNIENVTFRSGTLNGIQTLGTLAGLSNTDSSLKINGLTIQDVSVTGNNNTSGLIGHISTNTGDFDANNLTFTNLTINGLTNVGSLIANSLQPNLAIKNLTSTGLKVTGLGEKIGGLFGTIPSATLTNINVTGELSAPKDAIEISAGGIVGEATSGLHLNNIRWVGPVSSGSDNVGGIAGKVTNLSATNVISSGVLTINDDKYNSVRKNIGGLFGLILGEASSVTNSSSSMTLNTISQYTGGLFGRFEGELSSIKNCYFNGTVNARTSFVGGLAGIFDGKDIWDSYSTGAINVSNPTPNAYLGGLLGYANSAASNFKRINARGNVTISNGTADNVGGLIGFFRGGTIEDSYATGNVTNSRNISGGLIGMLRGVVLRSYSSGNVITNGRHAGGLVGYLNLNGQIIDSFTLGNVTANDEAGGLVGFINTTHEGVSVEKSSAFGQVSKLSTSSAIDTNFGPVYGTKNATSTISLGSTYFLNSKANPLHNGEGSGLFDASASQQSSYPGLDFNSTPGWRIPNATTNVSGYGTNFPYPILTWIGEGTSTQSYKIRGSISGLQYGSLTLSLNGGSEVITVNSPATTFSFVQQLEAGQMYDVSITQHPSNPGLSCSISNGAGTMGNAEVANIVVTCPTFQSLNVLASTNMSSSATQNIVVNGTLSNSVVIDLTGFATITSSNPTNFSLSGANLTALSPGSTILTANFLALNASKTITAFSPPTPPTSLAWQGTSPSVVPGLVAQWSLSATSTIASQKIDYYAVAGCSGTPISTKNLSNSVTSDNFTGSDNITYSYKVTAIDSSSIIAVSTCSNSMLISLPTPEPVSSLAAASAWVNGNTPVTSPLYTWSNPANINGVEVALGNTVGGEEVSSWSLKGIITSHTFSNLSTLNNCVTYYASARTVNQYNKKSSVVTHVSGFKWDNGAPTSPGVISISGNASPSVATLASWEASTDNCEMNSYEIAIGTIAGSTNISGGWKNIGNVTSYLPTSGAGGLNFTLQAATDYYTSIRAKDQAGNYSLVTVSAPWRLPTNELAKVFWFDASDRTTIRDPGNLTPDDVGFTAKVRTWEDKSSTGTHDAFSLGSTNDPGFEASANNVTFSGANQYLRVPGSTGLDNSTFTFKNLFVSFKTSSDITTRQVIFEQGTRTSGINIYLLSGKLYCAFWNTNNDGDGAQPIIYTTSAANLSTNTNYHAALVYDYTNYSGATGPNGTVKCYLNNTQMGQTLSTTSRLFANTGSAALGAVYNGTRYHDSNVTTTGSYFSGRILEAFMLSSNPDEANILSTLNGLIVKWTSGELSTPGNLALVNNSTLFKGATASWTPLVSSYFQTDHYEIAIGTSAEATDILYWSDIGNVTSYTPENGIDGISLTLSYGIDYYLMIKAIDVYGNESLTAVSQPWRVLPPGATILAGTFLNLDASDFTNVLDGAGVNATSASFSNVLATWRNKINNAVNSFGQATIARRPTFSTTLKSAYFDKGNDSLSSPSETEMTNSTVQSKVLTMVFSTNTDVTTRQFIFELGDRSRGMSIYIEDGQLYCLFQQNTSGGDGAQVPVWVNSSVASSTSYVVTLYLNYSNYTGANGPGGAVGCMINGINVGTVATTSRWYASANSAFIGMRSSARWHNSNSTGSGDYFGGEIHELQMTNTWPTGGISDVQTLHTNLMNKW